MNMSVGVGMSEDVGMGVGMSEGVGMGVGIMGVGMVVGVGKDTQIYSSSSDNKETTTYSTTQEMCKQIETPLFFLPV